MKYSTFLLFGLFFHSVLLSQDVDLSAEWIESIENTAGFKDFDKSTFENIDLSEIISNQYRFENDPISTYIGVFGPNYRRIDFHLEVSKSGDQYFVTGKSRLDDNIRDLQGEMSLKEVLLRKQEYITDSLYIGLFDCILREPGDRDGDGVFTGIFTLVFYLNDGVVKFFKTSSGDEPNYTNTFVGKWNRNNSDLEREVIFSFHPAGLYERLPFCDEIYTIKDFNDDYTIIKAEYEEYGWKDFDYTGNKTDWWK